MTARQSYKYPTGEPGTLEGEASPRDVDDETLEDIERFELENLHKPDALRLNSRLTLAMIREIRRNRRAQAEADLVIARWDTLKAMLRKTLSKGDFRTGEIGKEIWRLSCAIVGLQIHTQPWTVVKLESQ